MPGTWVPFLSFGWAEGSEFVRQEGSDVIFLAGFSAKQSVCGSDNTPD